MLCPIPIRAGQGQAHLLRSQSLGTNEKMTSASFWGSSVPRACDKADGKLPPMGSGSTAGGSDARRPRSAQKQTAQCLSRGWTAERHLWTRAPVQRTETHRLGLTSWTGETPRVQLRGLSHACLGPSAGSAVWTVSAGSRAGCVVGKSEQRTPQLWSPAAPRGGRGAPAWTPAPSPCGDGNHVLRRRLGTRMAHGAQSHGVGDQEGPGQRAGHPFGYTGAGSLCILCCWRSHWLIGHFP